MTAKAAILVVEDEAAIRGGLCDMLTFHGYQPTGVVTGEEGLQHALRGEYAVVLLDVMLPEMSGFDVCRQLRAKRPGQAILLLTARGAEEDVLEGFRCGADDYVTKPFSVSELVARVTALLRRAGPLTDATADPFEFAEWRVDPGARTAVCAQETITLSPREVELLTLFARERGRIVSRRRLLTDVWGMRHADDIYTRTVDVHIAKLRKKIFRTRELIETVRGEGYRFVG
jgi:two-component system response regulator RegX3